MKGKRMTVEDRAIQILVKLLKKYDEDLEDPGRAFGADPGCLRCTDGVTPNKYNTGPCPYHQALDLIKEVEEAERASCDGCEEDFRPHELVVSSEHRGTFCEKCIRERKDRPN